MVFKKITIYSVFKITKSVFICNLLVHTESVQLADNYWRLFWLQIDNYHGFIYQQFQGRHFNFFLGGQNFFYFSMPPDYWKKQHFICSNLTLFIVLFFLSFFPFFSFFPLLFSFFFFSYFFLFFFFLGGDSPQPPQMTPLSSLNAMRDLLFFHGI